VRYRPGTYLTDWTEGVLTPALESFTKILDGGYGLWAEHRNQRLLQRLRIAIELVMSREQDAHLFAAMGHLCPMHALNGSAPRHRFSCSLSLRPHLEQTSKSPLSSSAKCSGETRIRQFRAFGLCGRHYDINRVPHSCAATSGKASYVSRNDASSGTTAHVPEC